MGKVVFNLNLKSVTPWSGVIIFTNAFNFDIISSKAKSVGKSKIQAAKPRVYLYSKRKAYMQFARFICSIPGYVPESVISKIKADLFKNIKIYRN